MTASFNEFFIPGQHPGGSMYQSRWPAQSEYHSDGSGAAFRKKRFVFLIGSLNGLLTFIILNYPFFFLYFLKHLSFKTLFCLTRIEFNLCWIYDLKRKISWEIKCFFTCLGFSSIEGELKLIEKVFLIIFLIKSFYWASKSQRANDQLFKDFSCDCVFSKTFFNKMIYWIE